MEVHLSGPKLTHQMTIAEILERWPQTIPIFLRYQTSCVGCSMNIFETLEDAMRIYHLQQTGFFHDLERSIQTTQETNSIP
jgi:hybrid cluster-associated redox disulfide protein